MATAEAADTQLMLGVGLIEKDTNGEVLWVWCYPRTTAALRSLLLRKCCLTRENALLHPFCLRSVQKDLVLHHDS